MLLFVGYQGEGTLGAHLQAGAKTVTWTARCDVRCQIRSISGFSAHAGESELLDWLSHLAKADRKPRKVFLVHGDPEAELALQPKVEALGLNVVPAGLARVRRAGLSSPRRHMPISGSCRRRTGQRPAHCRHWPPSASRVRRAPAAPAE